MPDIQSKSLSNQKPCFRAGLFIYLLTKTSGGIIIQTGLQNKPNINITANTRETGWRKQ
jgi:hypothetical protein